MPEQSHDGGALFEFELQQRTDQEIEVKYRGTGHVYRFSISEDGSSLQNEHTIVPNPSSTIERPCSQHRPDGLLSANE